MKTLFLSSLSLSVLALACSALVGDNRYGAPHAGNHLNRGYGHPGAPGAPRVPSRPNLPSRPVAPAYSAPRNYGAPAAYNQQPAHYSAPANFGAYGAPAAGPSHYNPKRSVYQPQQPARNTYSQPQQSSFQQHAESKSQSSGREMKYTINDPHNRGTTHVTETHVVTNRQMHGAEAEAAMKKLMGSMGPSNYGSADNGFQDFVKGMGLPNFY